MIKIENLKKSFGDRLIFEKACLEIAEGDIVGIYGASGIGKSTLSKILCGIYKPDEGEVYLDGKLLVSKDSPYDRPSGLSIQMVYQQPYSSLDGSQKIKDGFHELIKYHRFARTKNEEKELITSLMEEVGLEMAILNHLPRQISGGEAQRIALARCLLFKPRLLILDEATSMLDVSTQANVLALVKRLMKENNSSVMLISHDKELVNFFCNQIYVFEDKHIIKKEKI